MTDLATNLIQYMDRYGGAKWESYMRRMEGKRAIPNNFSYQYRKADDTMNQTNAKQRYAKALEVLEVDENATKAQIKAAYRRLALALHPDRNKGSVTAKEKFQEVGSAYELIKESNNWE
jgi:DnaJ-domain-containing protein 1